MKYIWIQHNAVGKATDSPDEMFNHIKSIVPSLQYLKNVKVTPYSSGMKGREK